MYENRVPLHFIFAAAAVLHHQQQQEHFHPLGLRHESIAICKESLHSWPLFFPPFSPLHKITANIIIFKKLFEINAAAEAAAAARTRRSLAEHEGETANEIEVVVYCTVRRDGMYLVKGNLNCC